MYVLTLRRDRQATIAIEPQYVLNTSVVLVI